MPSEKRQRQDEGRLMRLEEQRAATQKVQRKRQARTLGLIIGAIVVVAGGIALFSADDADETSTTDTTASDGSVEIELPEPGASIAGETPCPEEDGSSVRTTSFEEAPPMCIDDTKTYTATLETTEGDIVVELDAENAPETVNNFVVLARYHYYDDVAFHRIVPGFVNQAGDPVGPVAGAGDPGYSIPDEYPADPLTAYPPGTIAMANGGPDSAGSQFFFVVADDGSLSGTGTYATFGKISEGDDVSETINGLGGAGPRGDSPTKVVTITSVTITEE